MRFIDASYITVHQSSNLCYYNNKNFNDPQPIFQVITQTVKVMIVEIIDRHRLKSGVICCCTDGVIEGYQMPTSGDAW